MAECYGDFMEICAGSELSGVLVRVFGYTALVLSEGDLAEPM